MLKRLLWRGRCFVDSVLPAYSTAADSKPALVLDGIKLKLPPFDGGTFIYRCGRSVKRLAMEYSGRKG